MSNPKSYTFALTKQSITSELSKNSQSNRKSEVHSTELATTIAAVVYASLW